MFLKAIEKICLCFLLLTPLCSSAIEINLGNTLNQSLLDGGYGLRTKIPSGAEYSVNLGTFTTKISFSLPGRKSPLKNLALLYSSKSFRNKGMGVGFEWDLPKVEKRCTKRGCAVFLHYSGAARKLVQIDKGTYKEENLEMFLEYDGTLLRMPDGNIWTFRNDGLPIELTDAYSNSTSFVWKDGLLQEVNIYDSNPSNSDKKLKIQFHYQQCSPSSHRQPPFIESGLTYDPDICLQRIEHTHNDYYKFEYSTGFNNNSIENAGRYLIRVKRGDSLFELFRAEYRSTSEFPEEEKSFCPQSYFPIRDHLISNKGEISSILDADLIRNLGLRREDAFYNWEKTKYSNPKVEHLNAEDVYYVNAVDLNSDDVSDLIIYPINQKPILFWGRGTHYQRSSNDEFASLFYLSDVSDLSKNQFGDFNGDEKIDRFVCSTENSTPAIIMQGLRGVWHPDFVIDVKCGEKAFVIDMNKDSYDDVILETGIILGGPSPKFYYYSDEKIEEAHSELWRYANSFYFRKDAGQVLPLNVFKEDYLAFSKSRRGVWEYDHDRGYVQFNPRIIRIEKSRDKSGYYKVSSSGECISEPQVSVYGIISKLYSPLGGVSSFSYIRSFEGIRLSFEKREAEGTLPNSVGYSYYKPVFNTDNEFLGYTYSLKSFTEINTNLFGKDSKVQMNEYLIDREAYDEQRSPVVGNVLNDYICPKDGCDSLQPLKWVKKTKTNWVGKWIPYGSQSTKLHYIAPAETVTSLSNKTNNVIDSFRTRFMESNFSAWGPEVSTKLISRSIDDFKNDEKITVEKKYIENKFRVLKERVESAKNVKETQTSYEKLPSRNLEVKTFINGQKEEAVVYSTSGEILERTNKYGQRNIFTYPFYGYDSIQIEQANSLVQESSKVDFYGNMISLMRWSQWDNIELKIERSIDGLPLNVKFNGHLIHFNRYFENGHLVEEISWNNRLYEVRRYNGFGALISSGRPLDGDQLHWDKKVTVDSLGIVLSQVAPLKQNFFYDELGREKLRVNGKTRYATSWIGSCASKESQTDTSNYREYYACYDLSGDLKFINTGLSGDVTINRAGEEVHEIETGDSQQNIKFDYELGSELSITTMNDSPLYLKRISNDSRIANLGELGIHLLDELGRTVEDKNSLTTTSRVLKPNGQVVEEKNNFYSLFTKYNFIDLPYFMSYSVAKGRSLEVSYKFNEIMQPKTIRLGEENELTLGWHQSRLSEIQPFVTGIEYDESNRVKLVQFGPNLTFSYTFDDGEPQLKIILAKNSGGPVFNEKYHWAGETLLEKVSVINSRSFEAGYTYNDDGELIFPAPSGKISFNALIKQNRVLEIDDKKIMYNPDGTIMGIISADSSKDKNDEYYLSSDVHFINGSYIHYIYVGSKLLGAVVLNEKVDRNKSKGDQDNFIAPEQGASGVFKRQANFYPILTDQVGSVRAIFNMHGEPLVYRNYSAWGQLEEVTTLTTDGEKLNSLIRYDFAGLIRPQGAEYLIAKKRIYAPSFGKWLTFDPLLASKPLEFIKSAPDQIDGIHYAKGNPLYYSDPTGLWALQFGFGGGISALFGGGYAESGVAISFSNKMGFQGGFYGTKTAKVGYGFSGGLGVSVSVAPGALYLKDLEGISRGGGMDSALSGSVFNTITADGRKFNTYNVGFGKGNGLFPYGGVSNTWIIQ